MNQCFYRIKIALAAVGLLFSISQTANAEVVATKAQPTPCEFLVSMKKLTSNNVNATPSVKSLGGQCEHGISVKLQSDVGNLSAKLKSQDNGYVVSLQDDANGNTVTYNISDLELQLLIAALKSSMSVKF